MLIPAIPPADYSKYFSIRELAFIFEQRTQIPLREALRRWANEEDRRLRIYYRPGQFLFKPDVCFHLNDVLKFGEETRFLRLSADFRQELEGLANDAPAPLPEWNVRPMRVGAPKDRPDPEPQSPVSHAHAS